MHGTLFGIKVIYTRDHNFIIHAGQREKKTYVTDIYPMCRIDQNGTVQDLSKIIVIHDQS
jgi:hypothetical protein